MSDHGCWVLTDGKTGMDAQALGLAEAVGLPIVTKTLDLAWPWSWVPPMLWPPGVLGHRGGARDLAPPWPDLLISCGSNAVGPALEVKRRAGNRPVAVHIQHPHVPLARFDLIAAPMHDRVDGSNVIGTRGALNRVTPERLAQAAVGVQDQIRDLPHPHVAVLIGGSNNAYRLAPDTMRAIAGKLAAMARDAGAALLVTPSRRTGSENTETLKTALRDVPGAFWDGTGENPYFGYLAAADAIVVTGDSVNMVSEACMTGKPVHVIDLPGPGSDKFRRFHERLRADGLTRSFEGRLEHWSYPPLDDTARVAAAVRQSLGLAVPEAAQ